MNAYDPEQITLFAKTDARGQEVSFGIKAKDRTRHMYVIGKTGMGKSTLLENMAVQDIKNGNGLAFIDPHGQTAETLLNYIPEDRIDDVLYFAPFDTDYPVSFNVMEDVGPDRRHLVVSGLMSVFKKIWVDAWSARMEYILSNTLLALLEYPDSTLLCVNQMLSNKKYRQAVVDNIKDPAVKSFWTDEFANYNERYMQEAGDSIKNKIGQFTSNPLIRNIVGQPKSSFDLRQIMDEQKIIIMNLSKGLVGESNANLLGSMLTTRIYLAAMSRANLTQDVLKAAPNFYFFVDEFQSFANATFADILSEARKYKLNLTIAHQYIEQMEEEVRNAVFGNVGTTVTFRVGPFDAEVLESIFTPKFMAPDIVNLGFAQIYLTLMIDGIGSQPFSAVTLPPIETPAQSNYDMVVAASRKQYAHPRAGVEAMINAWHAEREEEQKKPAKKKPNNNNNNQGQSQGQRSGDNQKPANGNQAKNQGESKPRSDNQKNDRPNKPKPHGEKSADELRDILRSIAAEAKPEKPSSPSLEKSAPEASKSAAETSVPPAEPPVPEPTTQAAAPAPKVTKRDRPPKLDKPDMSDTQRENNRGGRGRGKSPKAPTAKTAAPKAESPLKSALADALAGLNGQMAADQKPTVVETPAPAASPVSEPEPVSAPVAVAEQPTDDLLSPKKLERMMRVTGGDKSPLT